MPLVYRQLIRPFLFFMLILVWVTLLLIPLAWTTDLLNSELADFVKRMSLATGLCLLLLNLALLFKIFSPHPLSRWLCLLVIFIACLRFLEVCLGLSYMDPVAIWLWGFPLNHPSGDMAQLTSICLILSGIAIFVSADVLTRKSMSSHLASLALIFCVIFLLAVALFGHFLNLKAAFSWMGMNIPAYTAAVLLGTCITVIGLNLAWGIKNLFQMKILHRFLFAVALTLILGMFVFIIVLQQINYAEAVNSEIIHKLTASALVADESAKSISAGFEIREVILFLTLGFILVCLIIFSGIFFSLNFQLKQLRNLLLASTRNEMPPDSRIPYINDQYEFGLIAKSIESFIKLNQSRSRLQSRLERTIEAMPNGIIIISREGKIELVNPAVERMFGYEKNQLIGQPLEILLPQSYAAEHPQHRDQYFSNPQARPMGFGREVYGVKQNGEPLALEIGLAPIESDQGIQVLACMVDISERKLAEANLAASREKIEVSSKSLGIGIWEYWPAKNKLVWDETMFSLYGVDPANFKGTYEDWRRLVHSDDIVEQELKFLSAIKNRSEFIAKFRIVTDSQEVKYVQAKAKVEKKSETESFRIIGSNFDVTREEMVLKKIQQLDNLRLAIVEQSDDAIISKTPQGIVTSWNKGAEKMFGFRSHEAIGRNIKELVIPKEKYQEHDELMARVRNGEHISHYMTQALTKEGKSVDISVNFSPIRDDKGNIISISGIKRDVSESINAARNLVKHQKELERSNKSLETFAYVASHDLKAPLRGIQQLTTWLEEDILENNFSSVTETTEKIKVRIKRMENLLDDLLTYYRVEKMQVFYKELDVATSAQDLFVMNNTRLGMQLILSEDLPRFVTYITPFEQVMTNLLTNAIKHHDKPDGHISISAKLIDNDWYEFCVKDDGPGIDPQFHERIFNMFQTLKPRDEVEGSGVGLALVKKIVEQYGGQVRVESHGRGTAFYFTWPINIKNQQL